MVPDQRRKERKRSVTDTRKKEINERDRERPGRLMELGKEWLEDEEKKERETTRGESEAIIALRRQGLWRQCKP